MKILTQALYLLSVCLLYGCGGETENTPQQVNTEINDVKEITVSKNTTPLSSFDYKRKVAGKSFSSAQLIPFDFMNASAQILSPADNEIVKGNITIQADSIEDEEGIDKIWLGFSGSDKAQIICNENCTSPYQLFETGVNPYHFSQLPGSIQLQIWVQDLQGNVSIAQSKQISWLPNKLILNEVSREDDKVTLSWNASPESVRYNAYLSDMPIDDIAEFKIVGSNQRHISITSTNHVFAQLEPRKNYYGLITGIDGSGESAFSDNVLIQASEIIIPTAQNDEFEVEQFNTLNGNLLENDSDNGFGPIQVQLDAVILPEHGELSLFENGDFIYVPVSNFFGFDSFRYRIINPQGITAEATVTIHVKQINQAPIALFNQFTLKANSLLSASGNELILNDIDFEGDNLTINPIPVKNVSHGTLILETSGSFSYEPDAEFVGEDSFIYQVEDGKGGFDTAEVKLIVTNEIPTPAHVSINNEYSLKEDEILLIAAPGILENDQGDNLEALSLSIAQAPINGVLELTGSGSFRYFPNENFYGTDYFIYQLESSEGITSSAFVVLNITAVNDAPLAQHDQITVSQNKAIEISVLDNDFDLDSGIDNASVSIIESALNGSATVNTASGTISYISNVDFRGQDYFSYQVADLEGLKSNVATVYVNVTGPNKSPVANNDNAQTLQSTAVEINILENDSDSDGALDLSSLKIVTLPQNGQAEFTIDTGLLVYTPNDNFFGQDSLTYHISDNEGALSNTATVVITVTRVNQAPIANNDSFQVEKGASKILDILQNDTDLDGGLDASSIEVISQTQFGTLQVLSEGSIEYINTDPSAVSDSFTYRVKDLEGANSNIASVSIELFVIDTSPISISDNAVIFKNQSTTLNVLNNDDFKGINLSQSPVLIAESPSHGEIQIINATGDLVYSPNFNFVGTDIFSYQAVNIKGETSEVTTVTILVNDKNYAPVINAATAQITTLASNGDFVVGLSASDPDNDELTFELLGDFSGLFNVNNLGEVTINDIDTLVANGNAQYIINTKVCDVVEPPLCAQSTLTVNVEEVLPTEIAILNPDFGHAGIAPINLRASLEYHEVGKAISLPDGSFLIASGIGHYDETQGRNIHRAAVTKVSSNGDIDNSFANEGVFESDLDILIDGLPQNVVAQKITFDDTNKLIYVTGYIDQGSAQDFFILRLTETGELDNSFANNGVFILLSEVDTRASSIHTNLESGTLICLINYENAGLTSGRLIRFDIATSSVSHSVDVSADMGSETTGFISFTNNTLMVFGNTMNSNGNQDIFLRKFNSNDLTADTSFQNTGYLQIDIAAENVDNRIKSLILLSDNQLMITGDHLTQAGDSITPTKYSLFLLKMDQQGNLATSFNAVGYRIYDESELPSYSEDVDILSLSAQGIDLKEIDNAIYITINREVYNSNYAVQMIKVSLDGVIDTDWSMPHSGVTVYEIDGIRAHGTIQTASGFMVYGHNHGVVGYNYFASQWFAKVSLVGGLDTNFGYLGQATLNSSSSDELVVSSAKQSNGNLLLTGHALNWQNERVPYIYSIDYLGEADKSFGKFGLSRLNFYSDAVSSSITVNDDDSLYLTGNEGDSSAFISKFNSVGKPDNFYAHGSDVNYISASDFTAETINIRGLKSLSNQEQLVLSDVYDGCINKSVGLYFSAIGDKLSDFVFEPPAGYECLDTAFKLDDLAVSDIAIYGIGTDAQSYISPRLVVVAVDLQGNLISSFAEGGFATIDIGTNISENITVTGYLRDPEGSFYIYGQTGAENYLVKLLNSGSIDTSFATNGIFKFSYFFDDFVNIKNILFDSNGKLVIFSHSSMSQTTYMSRLLVSDSAGIPDLQLNDIGYQALSIGLNADLVDVQYHLSNDDFLLVYQEQIPKRVSVAAILITSQ